MGFSLGDIGAGLGAVFAPTTLLGTGLALGSSALNYFSAERQNDAADEQARASMNFSGAQAAEQMAFQERMSNSSHQREVADMRAAGLNPLLSLNSGASSPSGAMGSGAQAPVVPELGGIVSGAGDFLKIITDWNSSSAMADAARANAKESRTRTGLLESDAPQRRVKGRVWNLLDRLLDRFNESVAKPVSQGRKGYLDQMHADDDRQRIELNAPLSPPGGEF